MKNFVCIVFDTDQKALAVDAFTRETVHEAREHATKVMHAVHGTHGYELWSGGRKVLTEGVNLTKPRGQDRPSQYS